MFSVKQEGLWKNWAETVVSQPEAVHYPKNIDDVRDIIDACRKKGKTLRVVGAGHSFTPLAATSELLVSLERLSGIDSVDDENNLVTVWAGTNLKELGGFLHEHGLAMENLGDINKQAIAGAISTGTHGTGIDFGSLSTQVTMLTIVTPSGNVMEVSATKNAEYFQALRVSLGMLGVIVKVQLRVIRAHQLVSESYRTSLQGCFDKLNELRDSNRHFEFYWFPHTKTVQVKTMNSNVDKTLPEKKGNAFNKIVLENGVFWMLSEMSRMQPRLAGAVSNVSALGVPTGKEIGNSHELYVTPRLVKFYEMEYSVPAESMASVLKDIRYVIEKKKIRVHFPIECRYVKADDIWLSPSYHRDSAYIAVHMYKGMAFQAYFDAIEEVFRHYEGRPHWGKMHSMPRKRLAAVYPKWNDFLRVREEFDPEGMLLNGYLRELFGIY